MIGKLEELALIARCVAVDDRRAFGRLVDEYREPLRRFLYNLCGNNAVLADDLAQDTFLKAYTSLRAFKGISRFKTWLYTIAYREFIDYTRSARSLESPLEEAAQVICDSDLTSATEASYDIKVALSALNQHERSLVLLYYMEDKPIKEISLITGMPEGTIKVYLSRARTKMKNILS